MDPNTPAPWWALYALAAAVLAVFAAALGAAYIAGDEKLAENLSIGALGAMTMALGYFFGSSQGSQKKDETIAAQGAALAVSAPVAPVAPAAPPAVPPAP